MKPSQSLLKLIVKIIILMILLVCMFIISAFLYSARYWPDVYNYINANITIKRIPTISELNIQIVEVGYDYTTEVYSTTDADYFELSTTDDFDADEFMTARFEAKNKVKRNVMLEEIKDYKELPVRPIFVDYVFLEEPLEVDNKNTKEEEEEVIRTMITKKVIDGETKTLTKSDNDVNMATIGKHYNKETKKNILERLIELKYDKTEKDIEEIKKEDPIKPTTTKEGYLVGGEFDHEVKSQSTTEPVEITTDRNEKSNDGESEFNLLTDLVDMSKMSTRSPEDVEMFAEMLKEGHQNATFQSTIFPWIATIFIKNSSENSQFNYFCDGALLSEKVILTGGRCVHHSMGVILPEDILVFLGKRNLQAMDGGEKLYMVKKVVLHENFTVDLDGTAQNDLAILVLEVAAEFDERVQSSCIHLEEATEVQEAATTAWGPNGQLLPIFFEEQKSDICFDKGEDIFCATYSQDVPLCPSYGGVYATKRMSRWCVQGIFYGDPTKNGFCLNRNVLFTSLRNYFDWIDDYIAINTNIL